MSDKDLNMNELRAKYPMIKANTLEKFHSKIAQLQPPPLTEEKEEIVFDIDSPGEVTEVIEPETVSQGAPPIEDKKPKKAKKEHPLVAKYKEQSDDFIKFIEADEDPKGRVFILMVAGDVKTGYYKLLKYKGIGATQTLRTARTKSLQEFLNSI